MLSIPDPRHLQELRRADGSRGQDRFAPRAGEYAVLLVDELNAFCITSIKLDSRGQCAGQDAEVRPVRHRAEEGVGRAPAPAALLVHLEVRAAEVVAAVEAVDLGNAALGGGLAPGVDDVPAHARILDPHLAARAVDAVGAALVVFQGAEYRHDVVPGPAPVAERRPVVPVLLLAAHVD